MINIENLIAHLREDDVRLYEAINNVADEVNILSSAGGAAGNIWTKASDTIYNTNSPGGRIGINRLDPLANLHVQGEKNTDYIMLASNFSGKSLFLFRNDGRLEMAGNLVTGGGILVGDGKLGVNAGSYAITGLVIIDELFNVSTTGFGNFAFLQLANLAAPTTPAGGFVKLYFKTDAVDPVGSKKLYSKDSGGNEKTIGASPLTTKGDVFTFTTLDARLPVGANGSVIVADSTQATGLKWTPNASGSLPKPLIRKWYYGVAGDSQASVLTQIGPFSTSSANGAFAGNSAATATEPFMYTGTTNAANTANGAWCSTYAFLRVGRNISYSVYAAGMNVTTVVASYIGVANSKNVISTPSTVFALFKYSTADGDTNWQCITRNGGAQTTVNSGVAVDTAGHVFDVIFDDSVPNVVFRIDGTVVATITTNIPAGNLFVTNTIETLEFVAKIISISWIYAEQDK